MLQGGPGSLPGNDEVSRGFRRTCQNGAARGKGSLESWGFSEGVYGEQDSASPGTWLPEGQGPGRYATMHPCHSTEPPRLLLHQSRLLSG